MPYYRERDWRGTDKFFITWRAWWLMHWRGEMPVSDWLSPSATPDRPLPWDARVRFTFGRPVLYINNQSAWATIWPDGTVEDFGG